MDKEDRGPDPTEPDERVPNNRHQRRKEAAIARKEQQDEE